jgi:diguanylate cyclase (GGDEF)-like protein/PAS domain S-box-containing protein
MERKGSSVCGEPRSSDDPSAKAFVRKLFDGRSFVVGGRLIVGLLAFAAIGAGLLGRSLRAVRVGILRLVGTQVLRSPRGRWRVLATVSVAGFVLVSAVVMYLRLGGSRVAVDYDDVIEWAAAWLAAGSCLWASCRGETGMRRFWGFLGASMFVWGAGQGVWSYYEVMLGGHVPSPSLADVGFLSAVPLMIAALLAFPVSRVRLFARAVMLLDGGLVGASTLFVSWALVLGPVYRSHQGGVFAQAVTLAYPACDVLIVVVLLSVAARASRSGWIPLGFVAAGVLALAFSDSAFAYLSQSGGYGFGLNVDIGWIAGFLLIALAPLWTGETAVRRVSLERPSRAALFVPYIPVVVALAVAISYVVSDRNLGSFLLATGVIAVIILACRQLAALLDSVSLGNEQAARFTALVRRSSDLTTIVSADGKIVYQSPSSLTLLGWSPEQLEGRPFQEFVHPDDAPAFLRALGQVTAQPGGEKAGEWRLRSQRGRYIDVEGRVVNLLSDPNIRGVTINSRDVSERKRLADELQYQAVHDPLTGLANRALLKDRLEHALALQQLDHRDVAMIFLDLDDFKRVNDGLGHAVGDELLRQVAHRLKSVVRTADTVARFGGDEFAIMLDGTSTTDVDDTADRILDVFKRPFVLAGEEHLSHASVGIALSDSETADAATLLLNADLAMYAAKTSGKGRRATYTHGMHELVIDHLQLVADMRNAVERDELVVVYQPIIDLTTGTMTGVEALMRWQHPTRGLLLPDAFIPDAETSGLIIPMGRWLLYRACRDMQRWEALGANPALRLSVNLSARQLDDSELISDVAAALSESHLEPSRLTLEITETALLGDFDSAMTILNALKGLGVELAIDDFGTGYSSLSYLRQLPVNRIKIDRSFITAMTENQESANLVRTIMQLADAFHLSTVAEGVETLDQLDQLRATDCGLVQGYLFAPPLSEEQIRHGLENKTLNWPTTQTTKAA